MATMKNTVADMTLDELKQLINQLIEERQIGAFDFPARPDEQNPSWNEIRAFVDQHRVKLPLGAKSSIEILREDRDS